MKQFLITLLLLIVGMPVRMSALSEHAQTLLQRQKKLLHTDSVETFMKVTERLKTVLQETGEEEAFYDAWNNQITYMLDNVSTSQALKMADEMRDYAPDNIAAFCFGYGINGCIAEKVYIIPFKTDKQCIGNR